MNGWLPSSCSYRLRGFLVLALVLSCSPFFTLFGSFLYFYITYRIRYAAQGMSRISHPSIPASAQLEKSPDLNLRLAGCGYRRAGCRPWLKHPSAWRRERAGFFPSCLFGDDIP